ncbi:putative inorganic phosphate cotransporter [Teleopsis dalmanni]|uniref:putative inorganic phosphate cotransporter n=1 Tax=Teleopsis dalmanni TaxID=139649 RepID=UPI0018CE187F|nr:putative inorganic phosphate cotransporter [Teleopsis dalmanni]
MGLCCDCFRSNGYQQIGQERQGPRFGVRHLQCFLVFTGLAVAYALRVNLSVAIVAMTDRNPTNPDFQEFDWDESIKSYLLSSFFWGYVITQVPGGYLSYKYGAKYTFLFGVLICSCLAVLTPFCAEIGDWPLLLVLRATQGICQGMIFPSTHTFLSKWSPIEERGRLVTCCYSGSQFGTVIMLFVSGFMASSWMGWPSIFYASGVAGILWSIVWYMLSASTPAEHPFITNNERRFIDNSMSESRIVHTEQTRMLHSPPWLKILTSRPFLTLLLVHCSNNWGFWTLMTEIPTFMKNILGVNIRSNGPLSALPYLVMCILSFCFTILADFINGLNGITLSFSRKFFNTLGQWVPMCALITLGYITTSNTNVSTIAVTLLTVAVGVNSATYLGIQVNHIDLSPNYAGALMGITNCVANIIAIIAPLAVGVIVTDETNPMQWRVVFYVSASFYFVGSLLFIVFGRTNIQPWNYPSNNSGNSSIVVSKLDDESNDETSPLNNGN